MNIALIPLRGGSKGIPGKNIKLLGGKPLCAWVIEAAHRSGVFDRIYVSTDSPEIAAVVTGLGIPLEVLHRPPEFATDTATTESVMLHAASLVKFEMMATIQATSPLTRSEDFRAAYQLFQERQADSLVTCVRLKRFLWSEQGIPLNYDPSQRPMRQEFAGTLMENGAFYFTRRTILEKYGCRLGGRVAIYEMSAEMAVEIDEMEDWEKLERLVAEENSKASEKSAKV